MGDEAVVIIFPKDYMTDADKHLEYDNLFPRLFPEAARYLIDAGGV